MGALSRISWPGGRLNTCDRKMSTADLTRARLREISASIRNTKAQTCATSAASAAILSSPQADARCNSLSPTPEEFQRTVESHNQTKMQLEHLQQICTAFMDSVCDTEDMSHKEDSDPTHGADIFACMDRARKQHGNLDPAVPPIGLDACHFALWKEYCRMYS